jgi:formylglycine-generating enzyme required for sulfatase activity
MSNCLCLACDRLNSITTKFCSQCGSKLQIQERYRALKVIGQGGFGKTFLAQDEGKPSQPRCVIKQFIYDDPATLREAQRLFEQEAVRLDDLGKHPQIPELLAHCEQEGRQYLVQEFIDGENLLQELKRVGRFSEAKIKELLLDLLPVLQFIHAGQVIHRDIKPENVIRRRSDGRLVLVDFGAAKVATETALQRTATMIGSPEYTAPEQARRKPVYASDIYSLGMTCLYLLTQIPPFDLFSDSENKWVWRQFLNGILISDDLGRILDKMIEPLVSRYQKIEDVLQDLNPPKKSPISVQVSSQRVPSVTTPPAVKPMTPTSISTSSNSLELDCGNGVKLELVKVMAGNFNMGSNEINNAKPIHRVNLREFLIGKYPITQTQYQSVMGVNPSTFKGSQNPVEQVSCGDAFKFCEELSKRIGQKVKLPTEAQWEYACRAGSTGQYCFGDDVSKLGNYAWYDGNAGRGTHPVGEKLANSWGLNDMHGNVWEWCEDVCHESYNGAPSDGSAWLTGGKQNIRTLRGGSWADNFFDCRSAKRYSYDADDRFGNFGFRVVV